MKGKALESTYTYQANMEALEPPVKLNSQYISVAKAISTPVKEEEKSLLF